MNNTALLNSNNQKHENNIYQNIMIFLNGFKNKHSSNTYYAYKNDIEKFFLVVRNKTLNNLDETDLKINLPTLTNYQTILVQSKKYKNSTINRMMASIKSLYEYLRGSDYAVNPHIFKNIKKLPDDTEHIGIISPDEAFFLADLALKEKHKGMEKRVLIYLAISTSIRKDAITKIKYDHIKPHESQKGVYVIDSKDLFDKGKKIYKEIHEDMYQMLLNLKSDDQKDGFIFTISPASLDDIIKRLCKEAGFSANRNLSWHSLRKTGVKYVDETTNGDMVAITAQGGWSTPDIAYRAYIGKERKKNMAGIAMFEKIEDTIFDQLSHEELVNIVKSFGNNGLGLQLKKKAQEIISKNKKEKK